jgi:putative peptidoglycan lipid II flippase
MFLKAGALSLALLLASRLLGLARESAQAAAFGTSGLGDVAVLMLALPDWLAGLLASGALAYVLLPHWAQQAPAAQAATQRAVALALLALGGMLGLAIWIGRGPLVVLLAAGLAPDLRGLAGQSLGWSALALPAALLAALWATRLQHERDFVGMYGANLVVNGVLVIALLFIAVNDPSTKGLIHLGGYFLLAMGLRLGWLFWRQRARPGLAAAVIGRDETVPEIRNEARGTQRPGLPQVADAGQRSVPTPAHLPATSVWLWAALSAGLPLALPFAARSMASSGGEGALATFNYAWKLVELPLILAIQLVATLAFPAITQAFARDAGAAGQPGADATQAVRNAFALAWTLACAAAAGLLLGAPALTQLLFGWGRMGPDALARVAAWGAAGAWGLLPQALIAVALTVLATQGRMRWAAGAYALALGALLAAACWAGGDGLRLMGALNAVLAGVALGIMVALGPAVWRWLPARLMAVTGAALGVLALAQAAGGLPASAGQGVPALALAPGGGAGHGGARGDGRTRSAAGAAAIIRRCHD